MESLLKSGLLGVVLLTATAIGLPQVKNTDQTGAVIPGATITLKNTETSATITTQSGDSGDFGFPVVPVGKYELTVTKMAENHPERGNTDRSGPHGRAA